MPITKPLTAAEREELEALLNWETTAPCPKNLVRRLLDERDALAQQLADARRDPFVECPNCGNTFDPAGKADHERPDPTREGE